MLIFLSALLGILSSAQAAPIKVMTYNTMCDLCGDRSDYGRFKQRLRGMADTIERHDPDLLSLQEFRTRNQVRRLSRKIDRDYVSLFARGFPLSYADPVLMVKKSRFQVVRTGGFWLGPNAPYFSFGWKFAIPRRVQWARLRERDTKREFFFVGTHFDNHGPNKEPSARLVNRLFRDYKIPVIFAGDTNLKPESRGYPDLLNGYFEDTFPGLENTTFHANRPYSPNDACNLKKEKTFPECRVDHVLVSRDSPWRVKSWGVDVYRYHGTIGFTSDHRAVVVELED